MNIEVMTNPIQYFKLIPFKETYVWDVKSFSHNLLFKKEGFSKLKDILEQQNIQISHEEVKKQKLQIISKINFSGELFLIYINEINTYKGKLYLVPFGVIIFSKINARHGCIYFNNSKPFVVSSEYPVFKINETKAIGDYLNLALRTNQVKQHLKAKVTGLSKPRLSAEEFKQLPIPLPSLDKQKILINQYYEKINKAEQQEIEANEKEEKIDNFLLKELEIEKNIKISNKQTKMIYYIPFLKLNRWDIWNISNTYITTKYDFIPFRSIVIGKAKYGANVKSIDKITDIRYIRITDINEDGKLNENIVSAEKADDQYLLKENDFLIARSGNTVGKTFLYKKEMGKAIFAGYLVKYKLDLQKINPEYLLFYTKSTIFKNWIASNQRISAQPNINGQEYLNAPILLPDLSKQNEIIEKLNQFRNKITDIKESSIALRKEAINEFEESIFI